MGEYASASPRGRATFLYSATTAEELLFKEEILALAGAAKDRCVLTLTQGAWEAETQLQPAEYRQGRVQGLLEELPLAGADIYLCGPPAMIDEVTAELTKLGVPPERQHF